MADVTITPTNVVPSPLATTQHLQPSTGICGEAISAGQVVCLLTADSKLYKADANDADKRNVQGIAGNSAVVAGQRVDVITVAPALEVGTHGVVVGTPLFLSNTPGGICPLADLGSTSLPVLIAYSNTATALQIVLAAATAPKP